MVVSLVVVRSRLDITTWPSDLNASNDKCPEKRRIPRLHLTILSTVNVEVKALFWPDVIISTFKVAVRSNFQFSFFFAKIVLIVLI